MTQPLLEVKNLKKYFPIQAGFLNKTVGHIKAVDGIDLTVYSGETLGIVGESGCGKSTTGRTILRLLEPTDGEVWFDNKDLAKLSKKEMRRMRKDIQMIFQDPFASLNPRKTIKQTLMESLNVHGIGTKEERLKRLEDMIQVVGLRPEHLARHPHDFSGGQRQRISIARALVVNPKLIIADEPVSALDVSIQSQVLNLLKDLKKDFQLTMLFISHDLSVVKHLCDRVAVMYLGRVVEIADKNSLFTNPRHPYTKALLSAIPKANPKVKRERILLQGDLPSPANPPSGCTFHPRCHYATDLCKTTPPTLKEGIQGHMVSCHFVEEIL
ncbi:MULTISPECIES: ABC transporter ATP-binding protein [Brevibacillus]|uniref:Dipeptide ABC transporter ATP-binding protein n=1 Tax=Brevibacillus laterosporus TaxID=1465 RepID=A0AAP8Q936_BRELA|nr:MULTISPECIES: dipeptide ABC transporter ATP-binding protein [Brevibacillus]ATO48701.1 dipeptide/oligopeptide/nickel ABC transporter ATP-binding protein [Brevibacillus laterosporus DSM 25]AYB41268.1 dipeptide ABC transporter ATP-binding protein [Brevibacillus laterosporus]MBG9798439.1 peptide ABC transporter ATPase [Brevibacillus laterosporus]MBG9800893.1 peptide ABC transporter ATPase [Brevibacillus laterosporus]MBM7108880.1 Oligopeptide transport ATP-binding protein OppF [Brevibacillus lat